MNFQTFFRLVMVFCVSFPYEIKQNSRISLAMPADLLVVKLKLRGFKNQKILDFKGCC